MIGSDRITDRR